MKQLSTFHFPLSILLSFQVELDLILTRFNQRIHVFPRVQTELTIYNFIAALSHHRIIACCRISVVPNQSSCKLAT